MTALPSAVRAAGVGGTSPIISFRQAAFGYGDAVVVSDVSLEVHPGEVVAILGPNGSGKSTLVRGILSLTDQLAGDCDLFGVPRQAFRDHTRVGYVPQRHTLSASVRATAREIVATGRLGHQGWLARQRPVDRDVIDQALETVGLADRASTDVTTLSGGQQRRVLIARALASEPEVLVMDEPTAGVDTANQHVLAQVLDRLARRGVTMLLVTHELDAFVDVVSRVVVVDNGRVDFDGPAALFAELSADVLHDHHTHHHDDELPHTSPAARRSAAPALPQGPLDRGPRSGGSRRA